MFPYVWTRPTRGHHWTSDQKCNGGQNRRTCDHTDETDKTRDGRSACETADDRTHLPSDRHLQSSGDEWNIHSRDDGFDYFDRDLSYDDGDGDGPSDRSEKGRSDEPRHPPRSVGREISRPSQIPRVDRPNQ